MPAHSLESLLKELGEKIGIPHMEPTHNNNITLTLKENQSVVLQKHNTLPFLIITFEIFEIQAGRFRENILREALKFNGLNQPYGVFAFSKKMQKLYLFEMLSLNEISGDLVNTVMQALSEKVTVWKEALNRGEIPTLVSTSPAHPGGGIFGIKP